MEELELLEEMQFIPSYLREFNLLSVICRFFTASLCSGVIGLERGKKHHAAGLRTHVVVCIGAAAVMIVNQYIILNLNPNSDPARMGAQVVSGIGFLGAGTIVITGRQRGQQVKGLTTAAGLWASACMGLCAGVGFFEGAIIMCVFLYAVIAILNLLDERFIKTSLTMQMYLEYDSSTRFSEVLGVLRGEHWHVVSIETVSEDAALGVGLLLGLQKSEGRSRDDFECILSRVRSTQGVLFAERI